MFCLYFWFNFQNSWVLKKICRTGWNTFEEIKMMETGRLQCRILAFYGSFLHVRHWQALKPDCELGWAARLKPWAMGMQSPALPVQCQGMSLCLCHQASCQPSRVPCSVHDANMPFPVHSSKQLPKCTLKSRVPTTCHPSVLGHNCTRQ